MIEKPGAVISALVAMAVAQCLPLLVNWGVPDELAHELASWIGATVYVVSMALWYWVSHTAKLQKPAAIVIATTEAAMPGASGEEKKAKAQAELETMIDQSDMNWMMKKVAKMGAGRVIEAAVEHVKKVLYTPPPKLPKPVKQ